MKKDKGFMMKSNSPKAKVPKVQYTKAGMDDIVKVKNKKNG